jgi:hypothetical protein
MAEPLREFFPEVHATDIHDFGRGYRTIDFFDGSAMLEPLCDWIITNPPFSRAEAFVRAGLLSVRRGVAVLCRLAFLESAERYPLFFKSEHGLSHLAYFVERVPMTIGRWDPKASSATAYAWFIFDKQSSKLRAPELVAIPPCRLRLTKRGDAERFGIRQHSPLFDELNSRVTPSPASAEREKAAPAAPLNAGAATFAHSGAATHTCQGDRL